MLRLILKSYSNIIFTDNAIIGAVVATMTFLNPNVALSGFLAIVVTILFTELIDSKHQYLENSFYIYNSLLVGMAIGYIYTFSILTALLICVLSVLTFLFSFVLSRMLSSSSLPVLSFPFAMVSVFMYLATFNYSKLFVENYYDNRIFDVSLPLYLSGLLKSLGAIFFLPNNIAGLVIVTIIFIHSRIMFFVAVGGFYFGTLFHSFFSGTFEASLSNMYAFNYILIAIAIGSVILIPSLKNYLIALVGIAISVVLIDGVDTIFSFYKIPVFTIPFNTVVLLILFVLLSLRYDKFTYTIKKTPEESLLFYLSNLMRFKLNERNISLPFYGNWSVYQPFDGEWTHKGKWRYAYDFVVTKEGHTHKNSGDFLEDYFAFGEAVLSPACGYIVNCIDYLNDNVIGEVDRINNWGNFVVIHDNRGFFIVIAHLMQNSLKVKNGDYITEGMILARCGNSGYSPQPHIHIQLQINKELGSETLPFNFSSYRLSNVVCFNDLPEKNAVIEPLIVDRTLLGKLAFVLNEKYSYDVFNNGVFDSNFEFIVKMNQKGEFYFEDGDGNKLYFHSTNTLFYFYYYEGGAKSYLKTLFLLAPRIPLINKENSEYDDYLPIFLANNSKIVIAIKSFLLAFYHDMFKTKEYYTLNALKVSSSKGSAFLASSSKGFEMLQYKNITIKRK